MAYVEYMVEGISDRLKGMIRHQSSDGPLPEGDALHFLMTAALHYGGAWDFWVRANLGNRGTAENLMRILTISYYQPRFRTFFALQLAPAGEIRALMEKETPALSTETVKVVENYVLKGRAVDYLTAVKEKADPEVSKKAAAILREIARFAGRNRGQRNRFAHDMNGAKIFAVWRLLHDLSWIMFSVLKFKKKRNPRSRCIARFAGLEHRPGDRSREHNQ